MLACHLSGHRYRFTAEGRVLRWSCERCGAAGGTKAYPTEEAARRYARAFDRDPGAGLGRHAPLLGLLPLRLWRLVRDRAAARTRGGDRAR